MNAKRILLIALIVVLPLVAFAAEENVVPIYTGYINASKFQELSEGERTGYVMGLWDGLGSSKAFLTDQCMFPLWFEHMQLKKMSNFQLEAIFTKYLKEHPEMWHKPISIIFMWAMWDALEKMANQNQ